MGNQARDGLPLATHEELSGGTTCNQGEERTLCGSCDVRSVHADIFYTVV